MGDLNSCTMVWGSFRANGERAPWSQDNRPLPGYTGHHLSQRSRCTRDDSQSGRNLYLAAQRGDTHQMLEALSDGASWNWKHPRLGEGPLHTAAEQGYGEAVRILLEAGSWAHADDSDGNLPLHKAAHNNHVECVARLLNADQHLNQMDRASVNWKNHFGWTALHAAADRGCIEVVMQLLEHGADPNIKNNLVNTPLHNAAQSGHVDVCHVLVQAGADVLISNKQHHKAHELARANRHYSTVDLLLDPHQLVRMP